MAWFRNLFCREYLGAYIMTIGVIDECRRLGLGSILVDKTIEMLQQNWTICEVIYLHVIDYNESAIRFYERNHFL
jgi:ribosomal protein S18 acetylase RimI-like enzyme